MPLNGHYWEEAGAGSDAEAGNGQVGLAGKE